MRKAKSQFSKKQLIELRRARGLTQEQLAAELGTSRNLIAYYEAKVENPTARLIDKIFKFFNIRPDQLLTGNGTKQPYFEIRTPVRISP